MITIYQNRGKDLRLLALLMSAILTFPLYYTRPTPNGYDTGRGERGTGRTEEEREDPRSDYGPRAAI